MGEEVGGEGTHLGSDDGDHGVDVVLHDVEDVLILRGGPLDGVTRRRPDLRVDLRGKKIQKKKIIRRGNVR